MIDCQSWRCVYIQATEEMSSKATVPGPLLREMRVVPNTAPPSHPVLLVRGPLSEVNGPGPGHSNVDANERAQAVLANLTSISLIK